MLSSSSSNICPCGFSPWQGRRSKSSGRTASTPRRINRVAPGPSSSSCSGTRTGRESLTVSEPSQPRRHTGHLLFFPDYSNERKAFDTVKKQMVNRGLRPFLRYPATLKVKHNGTLHFFEDVDKSEKFMSTLDRSPHSPPERPSAPTLLPSLRRLTQASLRRLHLLTRDPVCKMFQAGKRGTSRHRLMCLKFQLQTVIATTAVSFIIC